MLSLPNAILGLSGFNHRAIVTLCRDSEARGVPLYLVASGDSDPILQTSYAARVILKRNTQKLELDDLLGWIHVLRHRHMHRRVMIAPSSEFLNRLILRHRSVLEAAGAVIPLVDERLYSSISDKYAFGAMCQAHGLDVPEELTTPPDTYPYVAKPLRYAGTLGKQLKPHLILAPPDRAKFEREERADDFYFQVYVFGRSVYLLAHISRNGRTLSLSQENLIQQRGGGSIVLARRSNFHHSPEALAYLKMLQTEGFHGLVMIELRQDPATGRCVMIEANPRMWGPMQFALDNGTDLFGELWGDAFGEVAPKLPHKTPPGGGAYYFWSGGLVHASQPYAFHQYDSGRFLEEYAAIAACDLFNREDTRALHQQGLDWTPND
jgi:predicted ATP-grasp superfamily ATP-dependent carboligase